jgi:hypothetical protein
MAADPIADAAFRGGKKKGCSAMKGRINPSNPQSLNLYTYTLNDPINSTDQKGLETDSPCDPDDNPISQTDDGYPDDPDGGSYNPFLGPPTGPSYGPLGELGACMPGVSPCPTTPGGDLGNLTPAGQNTTTFIFTKGYTNPFGIPTDDICVYSEYCGIKPTCTFWPFHTVLVFRNTCVKDYVIITFTGGGLCIEENSRHSSIPAPCT